MTIRQAEKVKIGDAVCTKTAYPIEGTVIEIREGYSMVSRNRYFYFVIDCGRSKIKRTHKEVYMA